MSTDRERPIPQPEDVVGDKELDPERTQKALRCHFASGTDTPCLRPATVSVYGSPTCDGHAIAINLAKEVDEWGLAEEVTHDWLSVAEAWGYDALIRLARAAYEEAREHSARARDRQEEAMRIANAARVKAH